MEWVKKEGLDNGAGGDGYICAVPTIMIPRGEAVARGTTRLRTGVNLWIIASTIIPWSEDQTILLLFVFSCPLQAEVSASLSLVMHTVPYR